MKCKVPVSDESCEGHAMHYFLRIWVTTSKIFMGTEIPLFMMTEKYSSKMLMGTKIPSIRPNGVENAIQEFVEN